MSIVDRLFARFIVGKNKDTFLTKKNFVFLILVLVLVFILSPTNKIQWIALTLAMFSTMSNDSIQTLGTFLSSNNKVSWWKMFFYISILFAITIFCGWYLNNHRLDFNRLKEIPYSSVKLTYFQFFAPIVLIILTYFKIPISSTFLILSVFASNNTIGAILLKTLSGYTFGFIASYVIWNVVLKYFQKSLLCEEGKKSDIIMRAMQWISTGALWIAWLTNDTSNVVVYGQRYFTVYDLLLFLMIGIFMIGFTIYNRGGPIQEIVSQKKDMTNIKSTTLINFYYALSIIFLNRISPIPMATTWIFIGILSGRELAIFKFDENHKTLKFKNRWKKANSIIIADMKLACLSVGLSLFFVFLSGLTWK